MEYIDRQLVNQSEGDWKVGRVWATIINYLIPAEVVLLLAWWCIYVPISTSDPLWFHPFAQSSVMTCLFQWALMMGLCVGVNAIYVHRLTIAGWRYCPLFLRYWLQATYSHSDDFELKQVSVLPNLEDVVVRFDDEDDPNEDFK